MSSTSETLGRRSVRLKDYDYAGAGAYFVTICTQSHALLFGEIADDEVRPSPAGEIVRDEWARTADVRPDVELDAFVVMPNHLHGIIIITGHPGPTVGATRRVAPTGVLSGGGARARRVNRRRGIFGWSKGAAGDAVEMGMRGGRPSGSGYSASSPACCSISDLPSQ